VTRNTFEYIPTEVEPKWQKRWIESKLFDVELDPKRPKKYVLEMFPYPSGRLHMGHVRNYSIGDVMARYFRMQGFNVLHPMGWDAFGLPAENAAIQNNVHPKKWTFENIANMKAQINRLGMSFDWRREVTTCEPEYYRWEQLMFIKMLREGLAYREKRSLNWCPSCVTVLANEEVVDGQCWRCDSKVELKEMDQWFLKITKYADELLKDIDTLDQWPERIRMMQKNWIGKSIGCEIDFALEKSPSTKIRVFTTRPDTIYGATALILAPEHPLTSLLIAGSKQEKEVNELILKVKCMDRIERSSETAEKLGAFTGAYAFHPLTRERVPIWVANFVLTDYGTGALMAVPAHDIRDFAFAQKYKIPIKRVVKGSLQKDAQKSDPQTSELPFCGDGFAVNSPAIEGLSSENAKNKIIELLTEKKAGCAKVNFRLRDWGISRQRYWGTPIPIIHCPKDGLVEVPEKDLPVCLPEDVQFQKTGGSPLQSLESFLNVDCPVCGGPAKREADTMATFVESSWYYARYCSVNHGNQAVNKVEADQWLPIDHYIGGVEHATGHLLYFRFFQKLMRDWGWLSEGEPAKQLICQGMVYKDGAKMSKSKGNVVDPDDLVARLGADTARLFVLFAGPIEKDLEWSDQGVEGCYRFLSRVYRLACQVHQELPGVTASDEATSAEAKKLQHLMHKTIKNVTTDIQRDFHYNTAISFMMELVNHLYLIDLAKAENDTRALIKKTIENLVLMLSPFAPHMSDELWEHLGHKGFTLTESWPKYSEEYARVSEREIVLQINGKIKDKVICKDGASDDELKLVALENVRIKEALGGNAPKRVIVVPNKLVNVVI
jgi:leucyl-tRNA synthetase